MGAGQSSMYDQTPENDTIMEDIATQPPHKWRPETYIGIVFGCFIGMLIVLGLIRAMTSSRSHKWSRSVGTNSEEFDSDLYSADNLVPHDYDRVEIGPQTYAAS
jgi:hypothetical protein